MAHLHVLSWLLTPPPHDLEHSDHGLHAAQRARLLLLLFFGFVLVDDDVTSGSAGGVVVDVVVVFFVVVVTLVNGRRLRSFQRLDGFLLLLSDGG